MATCTPSAAASGRVVSGGSSWAPAAAIDRCVLTSATAHIATNRRIPDLLGPRPSARCRT